MRVNSVSHQWAVLGYKRRAVPSPERAEASYKQILADEINPQQHSLVLKQYLGKQIIKASSPIKDQCGLIETLNPSKLNVRAGPQCQAAPGQFPQPPLKKGLWSSCAHMCSSHVLLTSPAILVCIWFVGTWVDWFYIGLFSRNHQKCGRHLKNWKDKEYLAPISYWTGLFFIITINA